MNTDLIATHLNERSAGRLIEAVAKLETAIAAGIVPNAMFVDAKDTISRAIDNGAEAFLATGPHEQKHHQSDWWLTAYRADAFISGPANVSAALKRATKAGMTEYTTFISTALVPLCNLLNAAKPLIKKRGELPVVKTPKQIADDADRMTCQCCGRRILANLGSIALHGYERPGHGWQTGSCIGAKEMPFEVSRGVLGAMIVRWKARKENMIAARDMVAREQVAIDVEIEDMTQPLGRLGRPTKRVAVTRETFDAVRAENLDQFRMRSSLYSFDTVKEREVARRTGDISDITIAIREQQARWDGWKQTHRWNAAGKAWEALA